MKNYKIHTMTMEEARHLLAYIYATDLMNNGIHNLISRLMKGTIYDMSRMTDEDSVKNLAKKFTSCKNFNSLMERDIPDDTELIAVEVVTQNNCNLEVIWTKEEEDVCCKKELPSNTVAER